MNVRAFLLLLALSCSAPAWAAEPANVRVRVQGNITVAQGETVATAVAVLGSVTVNGEVTGDVVSVLGDVNIGPKAVIGGDVVSLGGRVKRASGAKLAGREIVIESPRRDLGKLVMVGLPLLAGAVAFVGALVLLASTIGFLILVVAILILFERQVAGARKVMVADPVRSFLIGFLAFICTIPLSVFLAATLIGAPLALAVMTVAVAAICLGSVAVCEWIGAEIARRLRRPLTSLWAGLLGLTALFVIGLVPWVGTAVHVVTVLIGFGAVIQTRFRALPDQPETAAG